MVVRSMVAEEESSMPGERYITTSHRRIRKWAEARGAWPATVVETKNGGYPGVIRIDFPGNQSGESLERISWQEWFRAFDENDLVFLHQETFETGDKSDFNRLINRRTAEEADGAEWVD
jgi:hypothetical protein